MNPGPAKDIIWALFSDELYDLQDAKKKVKKRYFDQIGLDYPRTEREWTFFRVGMLWGADQVDERNKSE